MLSQELKLPPGNLVIDCHWIRALKEGEPPPPERIRELKQAAEAYTAMADAYKERLRAR